MVTWVLNDKIYDMSKQMINTVYELPYVMTYVGGICAGSENNRAWLSDLAKIYP